MRPCLCLPRRTWGGPAPPPRARPLAPWTRPARPTRGTWRPQGAPRPRWVLDPAGGAANRFYVRQAVRGAGCRCTMPLLAVGRVAGLLMRDPAQSSPRRCIPPWALPGLLRAAHAAPPRWRGLRALSGLQRPPRVARNGESVPLSPAQGLWPPAGHAACRPVAGAACGTSAWPWTAVPPPPRCAPAPRPGPPQCGW